MAKNGLKLVRLQKSTFQLHTQRVNPMLHEQGSYLAAASIFCHMLGMLCRLFLTNVIGDGGNNCYACAYDIYIVMLVLTSYCLPSVIAELVAERIANGQYKRAYRVLHASLFLAMFLGLVGAVTLYLGSAFFCSSLMGTQYALFSVRALAPAVFLSALLSVIRGFFQGTGNLMPTAFSQIIEQIIKVFVAVLSVTWLYNYGVTVGTVLSDVTHYSSAFSATAPAWGTTAGIGITLVCLFLFLMFYLRDFKKNMAKDRTRGRESVWDIYAATISAVFPLMVIALLLNGGSLFSQALFKKIADLQGYSDHSISVWWGIFAGKYRMLIAIPCAVAFAVASANSSAVAKAYIGEKRDLVSRIMSRGVRYCMIAALPFTFFFVFFAEPFYRLIFPRVLETIDVSVKVIRYGSAGAVLYAYFCISSAYIHALHNHKEYIRNLFVTMIFENVLLIVLMLFLRLNVYAVVISHMFLAAVMSILNLIILSKYYGYRQEILRTFLVPTVLAGSISALSYGVYTLFYSATDNTIASLIVAMFVLFCLYPATILLFRCISKDDLNHSPLGIWAGRIFKYLHLI